MQFFGSFVQSMSQRNRSHANQPIGGVLISPLSRAKAVMVATEAKMSTEKCIPEVKKKNLMIQMLQTQACKYMNKRKTEKPQLRTENYA